MLRKCAKMDTRSPKEAVRAFERKPRNDVQKAETLSKA